ncbi:DNA/RNA helicase domain-containing protein [Streptomyces clavuligerus]|nr:DNA/RNA helicase domain-containing protein [Streptomyces clavuligerus]
MALSVATRVEPELIRAVRVRLFPWLDVGDESDLWFGPWTATRTRAAIALRPDLLPALRAELADRLHRSPPDDPLRSLGALVAEVHSALPPALRLEERVTWIDVSVRSGRQKTLERALEPALRALLTEGRDGLADWLAGAWPRLPEAVRSTVTAWQLANLAAHRAPDHGPPVPEPPGGLTPGHVAVLAEAVPHVALPVSLSGPRLRLGAPAATGGAAILVPDTDPRVIEILSPGGGPARTVLVERDGEHTVEIGTGPGPVRLRTPTGAVYELVPERAPTRPAPLPERGTVAELLVLLDPGTQPGVPRRAVEELRALLELLGDAGLPEVQVLRQFRLPDTGTRVDAVIAGMRPGGREPSYAVVELRRWRHGEVDRRMERDATARVRRSVDHLTRRLALLRDSPELIDGFVHWYRTDPAERAATGSGRLFPDVSRDRALELLRERFAPLPGAPAVDALLDSDTVPEDPAQFVLRPDQEEGYGAVLRRVERAREAHPQEVIIVTGGPGSGRSAVGLALLRELRRRSEEVYYTNGSPALEHLLSSVGLLDGVRKHPAERAGFGGEADGTGFLLYDEAQCLRGPFAPRPVSRFDQRLRRGQVDRMIRAARVPVFLLDEEDTGHPGEVGSFVSIASAATDQGRTVREIDLDAFGAGAGWGHAQWVSRLLGLRAEPVGRYPSDSTPALLLAESPRRLEEAVRARTAEGGTARLTAGSAWPWYAPESEVRIGDWARPWGHRLIDSDPSAAHPLERVERVQDVRGCAFDWCGVLMGPDLVWREGRWVTDLDASHDPRMRSLPPEEAARCVVRLYRTLLTRGLHGTVLHSTDEETRARLAELIPRV